MTNLTYSPALAFLEVVTIHVLVLIDVLVTIEVLFFLLYCN